MKLRARIVLTAVLSVFLLSDAAEAQSSKDCSKRDPAVNKYCADFLDKYGFFILKDELKDLSVRHTIQSIDDFAEEFWKKRDIDPNTPENEFKAIIDRRIQDIKNEIFTADMDIPGTRFDSSGGLRSDMAHVYLFYGMPHIKRKLAGGSYIADMTVWYYIDAEDKVLFRFLFLTKFGRTRLYYGSYMTLEDILREISETTITSVEEAQRILDYLYRSDPEQLFISALVEFSYYDDVTLAKALKAPEPAAFIADKNKPIALGQPDIPKDKKFIFSDKNASIMGRLILGAPGNLSMSLQLRFSGIDWQIIDDKAEASLDIRVSLQSRATRSLHEFQVRVEFNAALDVVQAKVADARSKSGNAQYQPDDYFELALDGLKNYRDGQSAEGTLRDLIAGLEPGEYILNVYVKDTYTKKYISWQEIVKK